MSIGLAIIAKNEEEMLPQLLHSIDGAFDQVVLVDTGSTDDTIRLFAAWSEEQKTKQDFSYDIANYEWCDDFSAARNFADSMMKTDWIAWADCDDVIVGAQELRRVAEGAAPGVAGIVFDYQYAFDPYSSACVCLLKRERLVRRGMGAWEGRVHEAQSIRGGTVYFNQGIYWKHMKQVAARTIDEANDRAVESNDRNLDILTKWVEDEPDNPRVLAYVGTELAAKGRHEEALEYYQRYLHVSDGGWQDEYAQVYRKYGASLIALGKEDHAYELALQSIGFHPSWPDAYITAGGIAVSKGDYHKAIFHAETAIRIGVPEHTMIIINPLDYTFLPRKIMADAYAGLGKFDTAIEYAQAALAVYPDGELAQNAMTWQAQVKKDQTAQTFVNCANVLIGHDEQWKARKLLEECVPHYASDHPAVVALRSQVRERTLWATDPRAYDEHYRDGGSKPEDFLDDDRADEVARALPRAGFLLDGILEQAGIEQ